MEGEGQPPGQREAAGALESWRALFDAVPEGIYVQDAGGTILDANAAMLEMYGYAKDELVGQTPAMFEVAGKNDAEEIEECLGLAFAGEPQCYHWWGRRHDSSEFPAQVLVSKGHYFGREALIAIVRDITATYRNRHQLESSEARYRATFEAASDGLLIVDIADAKIRRANPRAAELFGRARPQLVGETLFEVFEHVAPRAESAGSEAEAEDDPAARLSTAISGAGEIGGTRLEDWCVRGAEGELLWVDLGFTHFVESDTPRMLVSIHDITERKQADEALKSMEERERVAERLRSLGELAAGVAHNFNNSLTSILAHAQLLARNPELSKEVLEDIRVIERVARGAAVTVRRIQSFARSRDPDAVELTDLNDVVANAVALTRPRWQPPDDANQWSFEWVHPDEALPVVANAAELCEVVVNLILNGLDAMPEGGEMRVQTGAEGERVWVEVRDTGVGIDAESQRRLFDPFFSSKGRHGLGMGLSVSHGIVTRHGGEIDLSSTPGEGSRFTVRLPRGGKLDAEGVPGEAPAIKGRPGTILLVDDDAAVRRAIRQMLVDLGHTVIVAEQGKEALAKLDEHREVELLLSDLAMPVLDGARLLRECSRRWPELPRLLMTGLTADADAKSLELADALLRKPLEIDVVERTLARFLPAKE